MSQSYNLRPLEHRNQQKEKDKLNRFFDTWNTQPDLDKIEIAESPHEVQLKYIEENKNIIDFKLDMENRAHKDFLKRISTSFLKTRLDLSKPKWISIYFYPGNRNEKIVFEDGGVLAEDTSHAEIIIHDYPPEECISAVCWIGGACYDEVFEWRKEFFFATGQ